MTRKKTISDSDLLNIARAVFVEKGFDAPTKEIARRAGISEGVLYQRFATKGDLFFAAMVLPSADLSKLLGAGGGGAAHLKAIAQAMTDYFRTLTPVLLPLMMHPGFRFEEYAQRHPHSPLDDLRRDLVRFFAGEQQAGRIGPVDPGAAALVILAISQTIAFIELLGAHGGRFPDWFLPRAVHCLWNGLAPSNSKAKAVPRRKPRAKGNDE